MKRQVAITGVTPEFLRWSVRQSCLLREGTDLESVDQTGKRLRAIRAAGLAIGEQRVFDGVAIKNFPERAEGDRLKAFRLSEVFSVWGGQETVERCCGTCNANLSKKETAEDLFGGCYGWLIEKDLQSASNDVSNPKANWNVNWASWVEETLDARQRSLASDLFMPTRPVWYGLWANGSVNGKALELILEVFAKMHQSDELSSELSKSLSTFLIAIETCLQNQMTLDVQLVPEGFSDGLRWTIQPHCDRCKAKFQEGQEGCPVCQTSGKGHPLIRRKVLGLRPYVDLSVIVGSDHRDAFIERHDL